MQQLGPIGIVSRSEAFSTAVTAALGMDDEHLRRVGSWSEWSAEDGEPGLLVFDGSSAKPVDLEQIAALPPALRGKVICLLADDSAAIGALTRHDFVNCVVSRTGSLREGELIPVASNLLNEYLASVEAYVAARTPVQVEILRSYTEKDDCLARLQAFAAQQPAFADFPQAVVSVAWEMLMNALIDAPSQAGVTQNSASERGVELRYASDGRYLAVSVEDTYGTLTRAKVVENLERSHRQGPDQIRSGQTGAGIGLYLMFSHASQLHFSVNPGVSTKVLAVMRVSKRYGEFTEGGRVFNFMVE